MHYEIKGYNNRKRTREEISEFLGISNGGTLTEALQNLISCDFLREYNAFGNKRKGKLFQLTDLFSLFYLKQVKDFKSEGPEYWTSRIDSPAHRAWAGYAFEQVCLHHIPQIKAALGISGVATNISSWRGEELPLDCVRRPEARRSSASQ